MVQVHDLVMRLRSAAGVVTILDGVTLDVPQGQFVAVTGPSGSGKSTLLGLVAGLDRPTAGSIRINGVELSLLDEDALARLRLAKIGYVFQSFHLIPTLTALENVAIPLELAGAADAVARAGALLDEVGLKARVGHYPAELSGASSSASPSRALWPMGRSSCWPTSPPATWTPRPAGRSSTYSSASTATASRWSW